MMKKKIFALLLALAMAGLCWLGWRRNAAGIP